MSRTRLSVLALLAAIAAVMLLLRRNGPANTVEPPGRSPETAPNPGANSRSQPALIPRSRVPGTPAGDSSPHLTAQPALFLAMAFQEFDEPFPDDVLARLESILSETKDPATRLRIAAVLHRYHRQTGTDELMRIGSIDDLQGDRALEVLVRSRTEKALPLIIRHLASDEMGSGFLEAIGTWPNQELVSAMRAQMHSKFGPNTVLAKALVQLGDADAISVATPVNFDWPAKRLDAQALSARSAGGSSSDWARVLSDGAKNGSGVDARMLTSASRLAGPAAARDGVAQYLREYATRLGRWNEDYQSMVDDIRAGRREWSAPQFDVVPFDLAIEGASLLAEWGSHPESADAVATLLQTYLGGRRTPATVESLVVAIINLDPTGADARLAALGIDPAKAEAARRLSRLNPLPESLLPQQLGKRAPIKIPGEE